MQKLEIKLDTLKYSRTFIGKFIKDEQTAFQAGSIKISKKSSSSIFQRKNAAIDETKMIKDAQKSSLHYSQMSEADFGAIVLPEVSEKIIQI